MCVVIHYEGNTSMRWVHLLIVIEKNIKGRSEWSLKSFIQEPTKDLSSTKCFNYFFSQISFICNKKHCRLLSSLDLSSKLLYVNLIISPCIFVSNKELLKCVIKELIPLHNLERIPDLHTFNSDVFYVLNQFYCSSLWLKSLNHEQKNYSLHPF